MKVMIMERTTNFRSLLATSTPPELRTKAAGQVHGMHLGRCLRRAHDQHSSPPQQPYLTSQPHSSIARNTCKRCNKHKLCTQQAKYDEAGRSAG